MKNKNQNSCSPIVPRGTSPKPSYDYYIPIRHKPSLEAVRSYRLFLVVAYDSDGVAAPVLYTEDARYARKFAKRLVCPITGNRVPADVVPLEIPRYYFN